MAKRRGRGEGTITLRADGRWMARLDLGRGLDGRRERKVVYGATRADVAKKLNRLLGRTASNRLTTSTTPMVKAWLEEWFSAQEKASGWRPGTARVYQHAINRWLVPTFGSVRLDAVRPMLVQRWVSRATEHGARRMVSTSLVVLRAALAWAVTLDVIETNPAAAVTAPTPKPKKVATLTAAQAARLVEFAEDDRLGALIVTSALLGLRVGEACGLAWPDVDLATATIRVRQQVQVVKGGAQLGGLKTDESRRTLTMPVALVETLKRHKVAQLTERLKAGDQWANPADLVFTMPDGRMVRPDHARDVLRGLLQAAGLPVVRFHALRHGVATLLLTAKVPIFDVSKVLGHSRIDTTADIYAEFVDDMRAGAAAEMDALLARARREGVS